MTKYYYHSVSNGDVEISKSEFDRLVSKGIHYSGNVVGFGY